MRRLADLARSEGLTQSVEKVQTVHMAGGEVQTITSTMEVATQPLMSFATMPQKLEYSCCTRCATRCCRTSR